MEILITGKLFWASKDPEMGMWLSVVQIAHLYILPAVNSSVMRQPMLSVSLQSLMLQKTGSVQSLCTGWQVVILGPSMFQYWLDRYILACDLGFEIYLAVLSLVAVLVEVLWSNQCVCKKSICILQIFCVLTLKTFEQNASLKHFPEVFNMLNKF